MSTTTLGAVQEIAELRAENAELKKQLDREPRDGDDPIAVLRAEVDRLRAQRDGLLQAMKELLSKQRPNRTDVSDVWDRASAAIARCEDERG